MARVIGTVKSIQGKAAVKTVDDQLKTLQAGDVLHENEMVYALGAESSVTLNLEGGRTLTLNGYDEILLDSSVFAALEKGESLDVDALRQAIADGLDEGKSDETAAGNEVLSDSNAGADFAVRNDARGNVSSSLRGTDTSALGVTLESDNLQVQNAAPIGVDDTGTAIEEGKGEDYDAPVVATGNLLDNDRDDQMPNPPADLDISDVVSNDTANAVTLVDGNFIIVGKYGTLIINAETGAYTYTIDDSNADVDALNVGDSVTESFNYTVTDGSLSDEAVLTLTINGSNDAPVAVSDRDFVKEAGYHQRPSTAEGNVITDPSSGDDDVDNEHIWVVNVQKVSGQGGGHGGEGEEEEGSHNGGYGGEERGGEENEGGHNGGEGSGQEGGYGPGGHNAPTGYDFSVNGKYGVLFMWENGDYVYMLKNGKEQVDSLNEGDRVSETFSYTITDGDKYATAELKISIQGTNDAPTAVADNVEISEDDYAPFLWFKPALTIDALANDLDVDSEDDPSNFTLVHVSVEGGWQNGFAWIDPHTDTIKYVPNWLGNQSLNYDDVKDITINYTMRDDSGATSSSTVTVTIMGMNDYPVAFLDFAKGDENHTFLVNVLANDWDVDSEDNPSNFELTNIYYDGPGTASIDNNQLKFEPGTAFDYLDDGEKAYVNIRYQMSDDSGAQSWSYAKITLIGSNDGPVAVDDFTVADFDTYTLTLGNRAGWDGVTITPINGNLWKEDDGHGNDKLGVKSTTNDSALIDNNGPDQAIKFTFNGMLQHVEVRLSSFNSTHNDNDTATWKVMLGTSTDPIAQGSFSSSNTNATLIIDTGGLVFDTLIIGTPVGEQSDFYINAIQGYGLEINSELTITENNPIVIPESYLIANDSDVEGDPLNIVDIDTNGTIGEVSIDEYGNVTYDPAGRFDHLAAGELETDTFTYVLSDGDLTDTATVTINIIGSNSSDDSSTNLNISSLFCGYDGEEGYDTVTLSNALGTVNFDWLNNIENIEHIDLQGGSKTLVNITPENVMDITDSDNFLKISGEADDSLELKGFTLDTNTSTTLEGYDAYTGTFGGEEVTLHIDEDITDINIIP